MSYIQNLWLKLKQYKNEIFIGGSVALVSCSVLYMYFSYKYAKKEEEKESPRYIVKMTT